MKYKRIILTISDLKILTDTKAANCYKTMQHLRDAMGKTRYQKITIKEYADFNRIDINEIYESLNLL